MIKKVMLIDDDYSTNVFHEIIINDENIVEELIICNSADEAIKILIDGSSHPELIFLDINMPVKNAWDFLNEYENIKPKVTSKIIILSTTKNPADVIKAKENNNVFAFMTKPLDVEFLKKFNEDAI